MAIRQIICESFGGFLCAKFKISLQTQENISKLAFNIGTQACIRDLTDKISLYFPDMAIRRIICASLGEFLCKICSCV